MDPYYPDEDDSEEEQLPGEELPPLTEDEVNDEEDDEGRIVAVSGIVGGGLETSLDEAINTGVEEPGNKSEPVSGKASNAGSVKDAELQLVASAPASGRVSTARSEKDVEPIPPNDISAPGSSRVLGTGSQKDVEGTSKVTSVPGSRRVSFTGSDNVPESLHASAKVSVTESEKDLQKLTGKSSTPIDDNDVPSVPSSKSQTIGVNTLYTTAFKRASGALAQRNSVPDTDEPCVQVGDNPCSKSGLNVPSPARLGWANIGTEKTSGQVSENNSVGAGLSVLVDSGESKPAAAVNSVTPQEEDNTQLAGTVNSDNFQDEDNVELAGTVDADNFQDDNYVQPAGYVNSANFQGDDNTQLEGTGDGDPDNLPDDDDLNVTNPAETDNSGRPQTVDNLRLVSSETNIPDSCEKGADACASARKKAPTKESSPDAISNEICDSGVCPSTKKITLGEPEKDQLKAVGKHLLQIGRELLQEMDYVEGLLEKFGSLVFERRNSTDKQNLTNPEAKAVPEQNEKPKGCALLAGTSLLKEPISNTEDEVEALKNQLMHAISHQAKKLSWVHEKTEEYNQLAKSNLYGSGFATPQASITANYNEIQNVAQAVNADLRKSVATVEMKVDKLGDRLETCEKQIPEVYNTLQEVITKLAEENTSLRDEIRKTSDTHENTKTSNEEKLEHLDKQLMKLAQIVWELKCETRAQMHFGREY